MMMMMMTIDNENTNNTSTSTSMTTPPRSDRVAADQDEMLRTPVKAHRAHLHVQQDGNIFQKEADDALRELSADPELVGKFRAVIAQMRDPIADLYSAWARYKTARNQCAMRGMLEFTGTCVNVHTNKVYYSVVLPLVAYFNRFENDVECSTPETQAELVADVRWLYMWVCHVTANLRRQHMTLTATDHSNLEGEAKLILPFVRRNPSIDADMYDRIKQAVELVGTSTFKVVQDLENALHESAHLCAHESFGSLDDFLDQFDVAECNAAAITEVPLNFYELLDM